MAKQSRARKEADGRHNASSSTRAANRAIQSCTHSSDVAVSPDGKWVAAGTGPEGLVWFFDAQQGKAACILEHGGSTVLVVAFSPDSKAVASFVPGMLKVWDVTLWASAAER